MSWYLPVHSIIGLTHEVRDTAVATCMRTLDGASTLSSTVISVLFACSMVEIQSLGKTLALMVARHDIYLRCLTGGIASDNTSTATRSRGRYTRPGLHPRNAGRGTTIIVPITHSGKSQVRAERWGVSRQGSSCSAVRGG